MEVGPSFSQVLTPLLHTLGWCLARLPSTWACASAWSIGEMLFWIMPRRRRTTLSNLGLAFPTRSKSWRLRTARRSFHRMVETALFTIAAPYFSVRAIHRRFYMSAASKAVVDEALTGGTGMSIAVPHLALWEALTLIPVLHGGSNIRFGTVYRPQKIAAVERWVRETRARHGLVLFSRKSGLLAPAKFVASGGLLGVLIDQNAGEHGTLDLFLGRLASCTTLQGILVERCRARPAFSWIRREGFWRGELCFEQLHSEPTEAAVTRAANARLETVLAENSAACESWLWSHNRWRCQDNPSQRFHLESRRSLLGIWSSRGILPRKTRALIVLPTVPGAAEAWSALALEIRQSRPDMELTVVCEAPLAPDAADFVQTSYRDRARTWKDQFMAFALFLGASPEAVREARRAGIVQRLGYATGPAPLTHPWDPTAEANAPHAEQWRACLRHFGLP